jgi:hypothetical protein
MHGTAGSGNPLLPSPEEGQSIAALIEREPHTTIQTRRRSTMRMQDQFRTRGHKTGDDAITPTSGSVQEMPVSPLRFTIWGRSGKSHLKEEDVQVCFIDPARAYRSTGRFTDQSASGEESSARLPIRSAEPLN